MNKVFKIRLLGALTAIAVIAGFSAVALLLWNWLLPDIFGLPALNYWQMAGIMVLARILFGGIGRNPFAPLGMGRVFHHGNPLREKWMGMTKEEQMDFIEKERGFHAFFHGHSSSVHDPYEEKEAKAEKKGANEEHGNQ